MQSLLAQCTTEAINRCPRGSSSGRTPFLPVRPQLRVRAGRPAPCRVAAQAAAAEEAADAVPAAGAKRAPQEMTPDWARAVELQQTGEVFETQVTAVRTSGAIVQVGRLQGFVPFKLMDPGRLAGLAVSDGGGDGGDARQRDFRPLVGEKLSVKVTQVIVPERRLICSEKAAMLDAVCHKLQVCLPVRELSWDWVGSAGEVVHRGQRVRCTVLRVDMPPRSRVTVSLKRMQKDPLKETLDVLLPLDAEGGKAAGGGGGGGGGVPHGVEDILEALRREPGVTSVALGRRVTEKRTVSQARRRVGGAGRGRDLEVWMTKEVVQGGFNLVARAGRVAQEIRVATAMGSEEMRAVVQRVLRSLA
eukprot:scaffold4.g4813.t1